MYPSTLTGYEMYNQLVGLTDSWFASIDSGIWTGPFAKEMSYELTYFDWIGNPSQPLIAVTGQSSDATTPEPATMLMFGMGLLTLPFARRLRKK